MKLLLDANPSWRLVEKLAPYYEECLHVDFIGLAVPAKDIEIWNFAATNNCVIITNDEDFLNLVNLKGFPPRVVLLRTGDQSSDYILDLLITRRKEVIDFSRSETYGFLEII